MSRPRWINAKTLTALWALDLTALIICRVNHLNDWLILALFIPVLPLAVIVAAVLMVLVVDPE